MNQPDSNSRRYGFSKRKGREGKGREGTGLKVFVKSKCFWEIIIFLQCTPEKRFNELIETHGQRE